MFGGTQVSGWGCSTTPYSQRLPTTNDDRDRDPQLGFAMGQMGWYWGTFWLVFSGVATWISGHLLGRMCIKHNCDTYPELGEAAFGRTGRNAVTVCQWFGYFFVGVVQVAALGSSYVQTFADVPGLNSICQVS